MTTMSLHGSSSFVALNKRKGSTPSHNCKRGGGLLSLSWVQTEADDDDEPTWLVVVRCLKEKEQETHPVSQLQARGWVVLGQKKPTLACSCMQGGGFLSSVLHCHCQ